VAVTSLIFGVAWVALVVGFTLKTTGLWVASWWFEREFWIQVSLILGVWLAAVFVLLAGVKIARWCGLCWKAVRSRMRLWRRRRSYRYEEPADSKVLETHLLKSSLYRRLTPEQQHEVARRMEIRTVPAGTTLFDFDDTPAYVGLILSGEVKQHRRGPTGHLEKVGPLADPRRRVRGRARTQLCFLSLSMADFMACVKTPIGVHPVEQSAVRQPFLRRISLCAHWHPQALARVVQLTTSVDCNEGDLIIRKGEDTLDLFFVQEGCVEVVLGKRRRRVLRAGAFFGEIGLLQNSRVVADVKARTAARCLAINKRDFLHLMTHNPSVGLQVERISSDRLGRAIFPLSRQSGSARAGLNLHEHSLGPPPIPRAFS
jgi:CRP-like cAMP-binding protein